jgi:hypothetical protein
MFHEAAIAADVTKPRRLAHLKLSEQLEQEAGAAWVEADKAVEACKKNIADLEGVLAKDPTSTRAKTWKYKIVRLKSALAGKLRTLENCEKALGAAARGPKLSDVVPCWVERRL